MMRITWILLLGSLSVSPVAAFDYFQPLPATPPQPANNPTTAAKAGLGKKLFFDVRLSGDGQRSCNSCHNLQGNGENSAAHAIGFSGEPTRRAVPTLWNIGFQTVLFWDGRSVSHESQVLEHLQEYAIMGQRRLDRVLGVLNREPVYQQLFQQAFPGEFRLEARHVAMAIAAFERTLLTPDSRFDRYIRGNTQALTAQEREGMRLFNDVGCLSCHFGVNFAGPAPGPALGLGEGFYELFPNTLGSAYDAQYRLADDLGRFEATGEEHERYMWRVPPLRNIELTAPYFHNGSVATLEEAVRVMAKTQLEKDLNDADTQAIAAFLRTLTGVRPVIAP